ncbi:MAG: thioredoxin family protein [Actinomycetes bacterium]
MVATESTMLPIGTPAPDFSLPDASGAVHTLDSIATGADALVVAFICNHCPYVKLIADKFAEIGNDLVARSVAVVAINSNDYQAHPDDSPEAMATEAGLRGYAFPYLVDESQAVARAYRAACTPDFFVFDHNSQLAYRGRFDSARPGNGETVTGADLLAAVEEIAGRGTVPAQQHPSMGCNIKWKPGAAPSWFA